MELHDLSESTTSELGWKNAKRLPFACGQANSSSRTRRNEEEEIKRRRAQPERPSPTGEEDEEEGKGPDHLAGEGEKGRCNRLPRPRHYPVQWKIYLTLSEVASKLDKYKRMARASFPNDQVVQSPAADQNDQVVQPPADEIKKARKRARRMEYLDRKKRKVEDAERQLEEMKADFAKSEKDHACSIAMLDQAQEDLELSTGALRPLQHRVEQQDSMINMLQQVLVSLRFLGDEQLDDEERESKETGRLCAGVIVEDTIMAFRYSDFKLCVNKLKLSSESLI
ncbi:hypothetical protein IMY05_019G0085600 [Salix suchowensis]|nr:hypothetical protein IMY05_019G0085600 [Salix suchowensis]